MTNLAAIALMSAKMIFNFIPNKSTFKNRGKFPSKDLVNEHLKHFTFAVRMVQNIFFLLYYKVVGGSD